MSEHMTLFHPRLCFILGNGEMDRGRQFNTERNKAYWKLEKISNFNDSI